MAANAPDGMSSPIPVVVSGFAAWDHLFEVPSLPTSGQATVITRKISSPDGRRGGGGPNIARVLAQQGVDVELISWLGDDPAGVRYLEALRSDGVGLAGVTRELRATQSAWMFSDPDGQSMSFMDVSAQPVVGLTDAQHALVRGARWLCIAAGPLVATEQLLHELPDDADLAWVVKADRAAFPPVVARDLLTRATIVSFNHHERAFLDDACDGDFQRLVRPSSLVVETAGQNAVTYRSGNESEAIEVRPIATTDTTGAGDVFAGGLLSHLVQYRHDYREGVRAGITAAFDELRSRVS